MEISNVRTFDLTDEETDQVEALFTDMNMHKSIISEMVQVNPNMTIADTKAYKDFKKINKEYNEAVDKVINRATNGEYTSSSTWEIKFAERKLYITDK